MHKSDQRHSISWIYTAGNAIHCILRLSLTWLSLPKNFFFVSGKGSSVHLPDLRENDHKMQSATHGQCETLALVRCPMSILARPRSVHCKRYQRCSLQRSYFYLNCILVRSEIRHWEKFCAVRWLIGWMDRWRWVGFVQRKCWLRRCTLCHASEVTCISAEKCKFDLWCLSDWKYKWAHTVRYLWLCRIQSAICTYEWFSANQFKERL